MKTSLDFRSMIYNSSWPQRSLAALAALAVAAVVGITLLQALRPGVQAVPAAPAAQAAKPTALNPNVPISGTGSAYDGSAYVEYLLSGPSAGPAKPTVPNLSVPTPEVNSSSVGGAYDEYVGPQRFGGDPILQPGEQLTVRPPSESAPRALPNSNVPVVGTGSAYDGGSYGIARPTAQALPTGLGIDLLAGTDLHGMPAGLTDYLRRKP